MEKRRIFALIGALIIPVMFIISIILSILDAPIAPVFLIITLVVTIVLPVSVYLLTKYPKDLAEFVVRLRGKDEQENKKK